MVPSVPATAANRADLVLGIEYVNVSELHRPQTKLRTHSEKQISALMGSIRNFDISAPVIVDTDNNIVDGEAVLEAAVRLGYEAIPVIRLDHLTKAQLRAYRIGINKLSAMSGWDDDLLRAEIIDLMPTFLAFEIEPESLGFSTTEFDLMVGPANEYEPDAEVEPATTAVTRTGDLWALDDHRIICGNSLEEKTYVALMGDEKARMTISDPPFNVKMLGHVSGLGKVKHREFAMANGEMSDEQFFAFLMTYMSLCAQFSVDGSIHNHFMDFRSIHILIRAGLEVYDEYKNLLVWNKLKGSMGSFYRNQHELIAVFKHGKASHTNTFGLGETGRTRTNVLDYAGANGFHKGRNEDLADHPTIKPTMLIADLIKDVSHRGDKVLDAFLGSGTTVLAAEKTGRHARGIEIDPIYVDVAIKRWQKLTGKSAILFNDGRTFADVSQARSAGIADE